MSNLGAIWFRMVDGCAFATADSFLDQVMSLAVVTGVVIFFSTTFVALTMGSIRYTTLISVAILIDFPLHYALAEVIDDPSPLFPACGLEKASPNYNIQHTVFICILVLTYPLYWRAHLHPSALFWLHVGLVFVVSSHVALGFNTLGQALISIAIGAGEAVLWQTILYLLPWTDPQTREDRRKERDERRRRRRRQQQRGGAGVPTSSKLTMSGRDAARRRR